MAHLQLWQVRRVGGVDLAMVLHLALLGYKVECE